MSDALIRAFAMVEQLQAVFLLQVENKWFLVEEYLPYSINFMVLHAEDHMRAGRGAEAGKWLASVAGAFSLLQELHETGYVHGDLKPEHIRFRWDGR